MKRQTRLLALLGLLFLWLSPAFPARADGIIIPDPLVCDFPSCIPLPISQLAVKYHHVTVTIQDQVAVTHVDQVFYNPNTWQIEGTYLFPLPIDAVVTNFILWVDGQPVEGKVLDAQEARHTYEEIVRSMRDPALLEYAGRGAMQARIFPIPPQGERRVELEYTQALSAENGLVRYMYPLNTEKFSTTLLDDVSISVDVHSTVPLRTVYSPSHAVGISRDGDFHVTAGYEERNVRPDTDFTLYYSLGETEAFHLLTFREDDDPLSPDGFFLLMLAPRPDAAAQVLPKDVFIVLDHSGSMEGEKFQQAQDALRYILGHLNPEDRFNITTFSSGVEFYAQELQPASEADEAIAWVDHLSALGSTDINRALLETVAMVDSQRPAYVIFVTDGLPTQGEIDSQRILDNLKAEAPASLRLFPFGVGYDVDTFLLDSLAQEHHGTSSYVQPGERLDEIISGFYARINTPVLTDLQLNFGEITVYDLYPSPLPDLFDGSQIIVVGRYREGGKTTVTLNGKVNGNTQSFTFPGQFFDPQPSVSSQQAAIPRLWATRKIGYLLSQVRLQGANQELVDQIIQLSIRYGIVTPYTSYLVTEENVLGGQAQQRLAYTALQDYASAPGSVSGQDAVEKALGEGALSSSGVAAVPEAEAAKTVKIVGARTFVWSKDAWVDTAFDPETMQTAKVAFASEDYFALVVARPELAAAFALGEHVIALADGIAYEVMPADQPVSPLALPPTYTPLPASPTEVSPQALPTPLPGAPSATEAPSGQPSLCAGLILPFAFIFLGPVLLRKKK